MNEIDFQNAPSPSYIVDESLLKKNLGLLKEIQDRTGCKILLAQKAFSMYSVYPLIGDYLTGVTSSSLFEARLGFEEMGKEVHIYSPAYREEEWEDIMKYCDHIVFNSFSQWKKYRSRIADYTQKEKKKILCGLRINPEYSEIETDMYNPCFTGSRMGIPLSHFLPDELTGISGLHFHTMCEQNSDVLWRTLQAVEEKFGSYLYQMEWLNFGGGHHITREDYNVDTLIHCIQYMKEKYHLDIFLEPGEAVALNAGYLVATVLDIMENGISIAILDTSAACHMPDVLEMPYQPSILGADKQEANNHHASITAPVKKTYLYRLAGPTCLAGDIIGDYYFKQPLKPGDRLVFCDMAIYSMVKNNTFNGINLPSILLKKEDGTLKQVKSFGYEDFKSRL